MTVFRTSLMATAILACSAIQAQSPTPPIPPAPPAPPSLPGLPPIPGLKRTIQLRIGEHMQHMQAQRQAAELAQKYAKTENADQKREIRAKLAELLNQQFDAHIKQQEKELADLEKEIANVRALLRKRQDAKATIVDRRIEQLVQEAEGLGWRAPGLRQNDTWFWQSDKDIEKMEHDLDK